MNWLQKSLAACCALFRKRELDADMDEEMSSHIEMQTQENLEAGMGPEEARSAAVRHFGWAESIQQTCRDQRGVRWLEDALLDARFGLRMLTRNLGFTTLAVLILALGIGGNTAVFSVVDKVILHPLPGTGAGRLVTVREREVTHDVLWQVSPPLFAELSTGTNLFASLAAYSLPAGYGLERGGDVVEVSAVSTTPSLFATLGVQPVAGRVFLPGEGEQERVLVASYGFWQTYFGGDPMLVGRTVVLSGQAYTVIGIMPPTFQFPLGAQENQFWVPHVFSGEPVEDQERIRDRTWNVVARLQPKVTLRQVQTDLNHLAGVRAERTREPGTKWAIVARPVSFAGPELSATLWCLQGALALLLLIACANVATLLVAQAVGRRGEFSIRMTIGAGRSRLMRQLVTEGLLLQGFAGLAGLFVAWGGLRVLDRFYVGNLARLQTIGPDGSVLALTLLVSGLTGLLFTTAPLWLISRMELSESLKETSREHGGSRRQHLFQDGLIVVQVSLAVVLLVGAGLLVRTVTKLLRVDPGLDPKGLYEVWYDATPLQDVSHPDPEALKQGGIVRRAAIAQWWTKKMRADLAWDEAIVAALQSLPGVESVAIKGNTGGNYGYGDYQVEGRDDLVQLSPSYVGTRSGNYFRTLGLPLVAGRWFTPEDRLPGAQAVIVNQTLAERCWPGQDPLGKLLISHDEFHERFVVAGVVKDMLDWRKDTPQQPTCYVPVERLTRFSTMRGSFVFRTAKPVGSLPEQLKRLGREIVPPTTVHWLTSVENALDTSTAPRRVYMWLLNTMSALGLLLSALGLYAVMAHSVVRRTREIGIRMALGATRAQVARLIVERSVRLVVSGTALGLAASFTFAQYAQSLLYQVTPGDPLVFAVVLVLLGTVGIIACYLPARRAAGIQPMGALRYE